MKKPTDTETKGAAQALSAPTGSLDEVVREFIRLLDIEEESDNGRTFRPNHISSCRAMDSVKMLKCIQEMKRLTENVEGAAQALSDPTCSEPRFSQFEIAEYVCGWLLDGQVLFTVDDAEMAIGNALGQLRCGQDGIAASQGGRARTVT